jgi:hypothetical protein
MVSRLLFILVEASQMLRANATARLAGEPMRTPGALANRLRAAKQK